MSEQWVTLYPEVPHGVRVTDWLMNNTINGPVSEEKVSQGRPVPTGYTDEQADELYRLIDEGKTASQIGAVLDVDGRKLQWWLSKYHPGRKTVLPTWRDRWRQEDLDYIQANYIDERRCSQSDLAQRFRVTARLISHVVYNLRNGR